MSISAFIRAYRDYIREAGIVRFEQPDFTVYVASSKRMLLRQRWAMKLLRHLDVAPQPAEFQRVRGFCTMPVNHHTLSDFMPLWLNQDRDGRIELIRRLGATMGMVHSLRHSGTGDILNPAPKPVSRAIVGIIRRYTLLGAINKGTRSIEDTSALISEVYALWGEGGGTLSGNWAGFPPVKIWENGLMIMDLSQASYSEPLLDLVRLRPQTLGLADICFFWEYFLQGYCATCELPADWKQRIEVLYQVRMLQASAMERGVKEALEDWQSKWWEKYNNYL